MDETPLGVCNSPVTSPDGQKYGWQLTGETAKRGGYYEDY